MNLVLELHHKLYTLQNYMIHILGTQYTIRKQINYNQSSSFLFSFPLKIAFLNKSQYNFTAEGVSSFPGTGYVIRFGLQFVSTIPTVGINIFAASLTAVC